MKLSKNLLQKIKVIIISLGILMDLFSTDVMCKETVSDEEKEIIEILDLLEHYDVLETYELYINYDEIEEIENKDYRSGKIASEKEEKK